MKDKNKTNFLGFFIASIFIHGLVLLIPPNEKPLLQADAPEKTKFKVVGLLESKLKELDIFALEKKMIKSKVNKQKKEASLEELAIHPQENSLKSLENFSPTIQKTSDLKVTKKIEEKDRALNKLIKRDVRKIVEISKQDSGLINFSDLNISITPPKGLSEDELNQYEQIFYSFYKRSFESYFNAFVLAYQDLRRTRPGLNEQELMRPIKMQGKIVFDQNGNRKILRITKWSDDNTQQTLFENTLGNLRSLPNPPKAFIKEDGEFTMYYQLILGNL